MDGDDFGPVGQRLCRVDINMDVTGIFSGGFEGGDSLHDDVFPFLEKPVLRQQNPYDTDEPVGYFVNRRGVRSDDPGAGGGGRKAV